MKDPYKKILIYLQKAAKHSYMAYNYQCLAIEQFQNIIKNPKEEKPNKKIVKKKK